MGMFNCKECSSSPYSILNSNPDPKKFSILYSYKKNKFLMVIANYPNCKNFEGMKVMIYEHINSVEELLQKNNSELDPHFSREFISPIARFKPTPKGIRMAKKFMENK